MSHTSGNWIISDAYPPTEGMVILDEHGFPIADLSIDPILEGYSEKLGISHWGNSPDAQKERSVDEIVANARLIAAAPDLLEALKDLLKEQPSECPTYCFREWELSIDAARDAIAKAEGRA